MDQNNADEIFRQLDAMFEEPAPQAPPPPPAPKVYNQDFQKRKPVKPKKKRKHHKGLAQKIVTGLMIAILLLSTAWFWYPMRPDRTFDKRQNVATILVAGTDRDGYRTDTMMLLYLDKDRGEVNLLSIPRDTHIEVEGEDMKLNAVYGYGGEGDAGMELLMRQMNGVIGYRPDGYILLDFDTLEDVINAMGGITFDVPVDMYYEDPAQDLYIDIIAGEQKLDGKHAVEVLRYRSGYALADLTRIEVQRDLVRAAIEQWLKPNNLFTGLSAIGRLTAGTTTDLSGRNLLWLAKAVRSIGFDQMQSYTLPGEWDSPYYWLYRYDRADLLNASFNPTNHEISAEELSN